MTNRKLVIYFSSFILIGLIAVACGFAAPTATPTPTMTPTLENTPTPSVTPTKGPTSTPVAEGYVDVGGYKLVYQCFGQGTPTVIIEAGGGDRPVVSYTWSDVVEGIQTTTRICLYDRVAGVRTSQRIAEDLHFLLSQIPVTGPYILVGHSLGGYHVRVFAHLYPKEVAGMVLVDTTTPGSLIAFATAYPTYSPEEAPNITSYRIADVNTLPTPSIDGLDFNTSTEQVLEAGSLGDIPLVVISANHGAEAWEVSGFTPEDTERITAAMFKSQSDLAALSTNGVFVIANTSDHFVSNHDPQTIIDALTRMISEIRKQ